MTVADLIERAPADASMKALARSMLRMAAPDLLRAPVSFTMDRATDRITLAVGSTVVLDTTLKEVESYVSTPADHRTSAESDRHSPPGSSGLARKIHPLPD